MAVLGFIGMGNMGYAMLKGCLNSFDRDEIVFHRNSTEKAKEISQETGIILCDSNKEVVKSSKYIIMAVKPQMFDKIIEEIKSEVTDEKIIISLAPGITIKQLKEKIGNGRIVRSMPNTPAMIGSGMTGVSYEKDDFSQEEVVIIDKIFSSVGKMKVVDEKLINSVVCASGSSPAYVFLFIEALADSVVQCGMSRKDAYEFVTQTVIGSAELMQTTGKHPGELKDMVCSPGGTTISGVAELEKNGFRKAIFEATQACFDKCNNIK